MIACRACGQTVDPVLPRHGWGVHPGCATSPGDETDHASALRLLTVALPGATILTDVPRTRATTTQPQPTQETLT